jgi:Fuc2NAc and GlcNAc transferase
VLFKSDIFLVLGVSVLGFLYWNWKEAKIFMGDVGSTLLGYNVAIFTIYYANEKSENLWIWIILFSVFWFDATYTLLKRVLNHEKLSKAHKKHAYQRLNQSGWSHYKVTNFSIAANTFLLAIVFSCLYFGVSIFYGFFTSLILLYGVMRFTDSMYKA